MSTKLVLIPPVECRVCFVTRSGHKSNVTAESAASKTAFRFEDPSLPLLREGEHVRISGSVQADLVSRGPDVLKRTDYRHRPHDGSDVSEWEYFHDVAVSSVERVGPPGVMNSLRVAAAALDRHVQDWIGNLDTDTVDLTLKLTLSAASKLQKLLSEREAERSARDALPVKTAEVI